METTQADRIIGKFGGQRALARALGHRSQTTVQGWHQRGTIPQRHHAQILNVGRRLGVDLTAQDFLALPDEMISHVD